MRNITLSGQVVSEIDLRYNQSNEINFASFQMEFLAGQGNTYTAQVECWGKMAQTISQDCPGWVVVDGELKIVRTNDGPPRIVIERARISEGHQNTAINRVSVVGRVGKSPEAKHFQSGANKTEYSLAVRVNRDETQWFNLEAWSKAGEIVGNHVGRGDLHGATGQLVVEKYNERHYTKINVDRPTLLGKGGGRTTEAAAAPASSAGPDYDEDF